MGLAVFELARATRATLGVYDVAGRLVREIEAGRLGAGTYERRWDGRDQTGHAVAAGVYLIRLHTPDTDLTRKLVVAH